MVPKPGERAIAYGGTRVGKSTAMDMIIREAAKKPCEILIVDSKPRFRAEQTPAGYDAARFYKKQAPGPPPIPGSVRLDLSKRNPLRGVFNQESGKLRRVAIAQVNPDDESFGPADLLAVADLMFKRGDGKFRRIIYFDELHDFFHPNGYPLDKRDTVRRIWRAGGERGVEGWGAAQRPKGVAEQCQDFSDRFLMFKMNNRTDWKHLQNFGWPEDAAPPDTKHWFKLWNRETPDGVVPCRIEVPPRILAALSKT